MNVEQRVQWVENIMEENARLLAENAQLKDIEAANKETIKYWRSRVAELEEALEKGTTYLDDANDKVEEMIVQLDRIYILLGLGKE